ncbi:D-alanyl-D-alanine carboxypeptidase family protein [Bacillus sp. V5-8f]|uniref:M15 family metallopeptidase n=1 Tax=Bacillus sp. V5-8f TaxID=2053044 RepID=UPI000C772686|nr:M15 family metallopeptidase [Bacillus sp. V5-8f]PLT32162.1 peptidase M15 [Bacillus sp. V5-8f]
MKMPLVNIFAIITAVFLLLFTYAQFKGWIQESTDKTIPLNIIAKDKKVVETGAGKQNEKKVVVSEPNEIPVLVNKEFALPENYKPTDLIYPDVPFLFDEKTEKRMLRREAAYALEKLFEAAENDGVFLAGVSAYRSYATQKQIYQNNIQRDGLEAAKTYSASPGTSEHETGLAIDVSGSSGICATVDCFGKTIEAEWLANHANEHGFIIRYPEGKQKITGYKYEPWHLRYVGLDIAKKITLQGITLEEYMNVVPVMK